MVLILGLRSLCHKRAPLRSHHPAAKPPCKTIGHHHHYLVPHASTIRHFHRPQALFGHHHLSTCPLSSRARPLHGGLHMRFFNAARQLGASVFDEVSRARSWPQKGPTTGKVSSDSFRDILNKRDLKAPPSCTSTVARQRPVMDLGTRSRDARSRLGPGR